MSGVVLRSVVGQIGREGGGTSEVPVFFVRGENLCYRFLNLDI